MSIILDITIAGIIALSVVIAAKKGFIKTLLGLTSFWIAIILAFSFAPVLKTALVEGDIGQEVKTGITEKMSEVVRSKSGDIDATVIEKSESFLKLLSTFNVNIEELNTKIDEWQTKGEDYLINNLTEYVINPVVDGIATAIAFILIFLAATIVLKIAEIILETVVKLPILKQADKLLGIALGVVLSLFWVCIFCTAANGLILYGTTINNSFALLLNPDETILFNFFSKINIFSLILH